jgi:hypothetical protein
MQQLTAQRRLTRSLITGATAFALLAVPTLALAEESSDTSSTGWTYTKETLDTGVLNGYQLALDTTNRKVYFSDAKWAASSRVNNGDGTFSEPTFTPGTGKLAVFDTATREKLADHSFLDLTRNDGTGLKESEPFVFPEGSTATSLNSMRTTFSPYGVAVDGTTTDGQGNVDPTIVTVTARGQDAEEGFGGNIVVYSASQGAPTDADRIFEFEDGTPVFEGPRRVAVNTKTHQAFVTSLGNSRGNGGDGFITVLDLTKRGTAAVQARVAIPEIVGEGETAKAAGVVGVAVDEENNIVYAGTMNGTYVWAIDVDALDTSNPLNRHLNEAHVTQLDGAVGSNARPTYNADLKQLFVSAYNAKTITVLDADPESADYGKQIKVINTGPTNAVEVDGKRGLLYSANLGDKNVVVFDTTTYEELVTLPTSGNAVNIGIDPVSRDVWVSNFSSTGKTDVFSVVEPAATVELSADSAEQGSTITVSGENWLSKDRTGGSKVAVKVVSDAVAGGYSHTAGNTVHANATIWAIADADEDGSLVFDLELPDGTDEGPLGTTQALAPGEYKLTFLSGSLRQPAGSDISRNVSVPLTITAASNPRAVTAGTVEVSGNAAVGQVLKAEVKNWHAGADLSYQWLVDGQAISGATGSSYTVTAGDAGKKVSVAVTASKTGFASVTKTSAAKTVTVPVTPVKDFTSVTVTISGDAKAGSTLTAKATTTPQADTFSYQWLVDGKAVAGATKSTYTVTAGDAGKKISVTVTASKSGYTATSATSTQVSIAKAANKAFTKSSVKVTGKAQVAKTLTAKTTFSPKADKVSYQWLRNGKAIKGATKSTYKVAAADAGKKISVKATASKSGYAKKTATSKATAKIAKATFGKVTTKVTGTAKVGKTLKVQVTVKPKASKVSYQWQSNGKSIKGATKSSYKVKRTDAGKKISVKVTVKKSGYSNKSVTSKRTATVAR